MMYFNIFAMFLSLVLCAAAALAGPAGPSARSDMSFAKKSLPGGYSEGTLKFRGSIGNVDNLELEGHDIQDIIKKAQHEHPELELNLVDPNPSFNNSSKLEARSKDGMLCCPVAGQNFDWVFRDNVGEGIQYLYNLHGKCGVNPHSCIRIFCNQAQSIFLCNDNDYFIEPDCGYLGSYAQDISDRCSTQRLIDGHWTWSTCGQQFDTDNYNVAVAYQSCSRPSDTHPGQ